VARGLAGSGLRLARCTRCTRMAFCTRGCHSCAVLARSARVACWLTTGILVLARRARDARNLTSGGLGLTTLAHCARSLAAGILVLARRACVT
jgi:hypothetical protein